MDVNVELFSTDKNRFYKGAKVLGQIALFLLAIETILFIIIGAEKLEDYSRIYLNILFGTIILLVTCNLILTFINGGLKSEGKLNLSIRELNVFKGNKVESFYIADVERLDIYIEGYDGQPNIPTALINPSKNGIENFFILNKNYKFRFKLISENHRNRLIERIWEWQKTNPNIQLKLNY
ncbi:hypothetical protein [Ekhidna sp.]|uniref:hypothetical protein n=1 Tax=Ekhidna sp. TaxID=2608089 RepID=UPI00351877F4